MVVAVLFQISDLSAIYNERLAIILGILTLISITAVFASCRICLSWISRLRMKNHTQIKIYAFFNKYHLYYWWAFGILLVAHFMVGVLHTGLPQANDPDANVHWFILGLGFFSAVTASSLFFLAGFYLG